MANERVLLVDDEEDFTSVLSQRLENRGMTVSTASNGPEAIEQAQAKPFDVVILDLQMPGMDGIETLKSLLATDADLRIILLTGHATVGKGVEAVKEGAMDFLEKPIELQSLVEKIGEAAQERLALLEQRSVEKLEDILNRKGW